MDTPTHSPSRPSSDPPSRPPSPARSAWIRSIDVASVAAFAAAWGVVVWQIAAGLPLLRVLGLAALALPLAILLADLASGSVHWFADRYLDPRTPVLGPMLIEPFREHHRDPLAMTRHDFFEVSGNNGLVTLPLAFVLLAVGIEARHPFAWQLAAVAIVLFAMLVFVTNQLHAWAHAPSPPAWVRRLQSGGLVLTPERHARHHAGAHDCAYCVTTGWLNPLLDRAQLFDRLEGALARAGLHTNTAAHAAGLAHPDPVRGDARR